MMYDQAMLIHLPQEDLMANFRYEVNTNKKWETLQTGDYDEFDSECRKTMVGVVRDKGTKEFSCMYGTKTSQTVLSDNISDDR